MKTSNMKKVIQITLIVNPDDYFDAKSRIAGMRGTPGFISATAVASRLSKPEVIDKILSYWEINQGFPCEQLQSGMRYAWI